MHRSRIMSARINRDRLANDRIGLPRGCGAGPSRGAAALNLRQAGNCNAMV